MRSSGALFWAVALCLPLCWAACGGEPEPVVNEDEELKIFANSASGKGLVQACQEIDELCQTTGKGCFAYKTFCQKPDATQPGTDPKPPLPAPPPPPTQSDICSLLEKGCQMFPLACDLFKQKCGSATPPPPQPPPSFDKGACCAAVKVCIDQKDVLCEAGKKACGLDGWVPDLGGLPPDGIWAVNVADLWNKVCVDQNVPQPPPPPAPQPLPGFDKATCCAAVKACIDKNDLQCAEGLKACGLENVPLPSGIPLPSNLGDLWKKLCSV